MKREGCQPSKVTYNTLIHMYAKANQEQKAEEVFGEMKEGGLIPGTFTYNILLNMCAESGQVQRLEELFQEMKTQACMPDIVTYATVGKAYNKLDKKENNGGSKL
jgi:pentatricopeptide repeat protein